MTDNADNDQGDGDDDRGDCAYERPWIEYRTLPDGPWLEREFDTVAQAEDWAHEHLGADVLDVSRVHAPVAVPPDWRDAGYTSVDAVAEWTSIGIESAMLAQEWVDAGFTPESASMWCEIEAMTPSEAAQAVNNGVAPIDVERIRRADPAWARPVDPEVAAPDMGIWL